MSRLAIVGNLALDRVAGDAPRPGGGVFWGARAAAYIAADAAVATRCADVDRPLLLAPLEAFGLPVVCATATETTAFSFHYEGDRRVMTVDAVGDAWTPDDLGDGMPPGLDGAAWVHLAALLRSDLPAEVVAARARDGRRLLLDAHGLVRVRRTGPLAQDGRADRSALAELAILKLDDVEAEALAGGIEPEQLRTLGVAEVLLTLGSRGAVVVTRDSIAAVRPHATHGAVDPTGAGDAFSLVYLETRSRGGEPAEAADRAARIVAELISSS
jgi:sugar/nucleoside kinase (ribokinase family)